MAEKKWKGLKKGTITKTQARSGRGFTERDVLGHVEKVQQPGAISYLTSGMISRGLQESGIKLSVRQVNDALQRLEKKGVLVHAKLGVGLADGRYERRTWVPASLEADVSKGAEVPIWINPNSNDGAVEAWLDWGPVLLSSKRKIAAVLAQPGNPFRVVDEWYRLTAWIDKFLYITFSTLAEVRDPDAYIMACLKWTSDREAARAADQMRFFTTPEQAARKGWYVEDAIQWEGWPLVGRDQIPPDTSEEDAENRRFAERLAAASRPCNADHPQREWDAVVSRMNPWDNYTAAAADQPVVDAARQMQASGYSGPEARSQSVVVAQDEVRSVRCQTCGIPGDTSEFYSTGDYRDTWYCPQHAPEDAE